MEIVLKILTSVLIFVNLFYCTAIFISQYYDYKRLLILFKQKIIEKSYRNLFAFGLFCLALGIIFSNVLISLVILDVALFLNVLFSKKLIFKFTRRSISFLLLYFIFFCIKRDFR